MIALSHIYTHMTFRLFTNIASMGLLKTYLQICLIFRFSPGPSDPVSDLFRFSPGPLRSYLDPGGTEIPTLHWGNKLVAPIVKLFLLAPLPMLLGQPFFVTLGF